MDLALLRQRSDAVAAVRGFFLSRDFLEVETPVRIPAPAMELHILAEPSGDAFLRTSPELHMKRIMAQGATRIFQIGPCFRKDEQGGLHHPEFTMLEWYRANCDYRDILNDMQHLWQHVAMVTQPDLAAWPWEYITVEDAFTRWAGWNPIEHYDADRFDFDLINKVEPALPRDRCVVLMDYPVAAAALSRQSESDPRTAERWELYAAGIELANAYSELTDPDLQRARFEACARQRAQLGQPVYPIDEAFLQSLSGMPPCGGIALGIDRFVMVMLGRDGLDQVMAFRE